MLAEKEQKLRQAVPVPEEVLLELARPVTHHRTAEFREAFKQVTELLKYVFQTARNVYTGSIGYIDFSGRADLNIAIRTMVRTGSDVWFQAGGGIVADSDPEAEYQETVDKARALIRALGAPEWTGR